MDNKQTYDNKIAAEELIKDSELDSVVGGGWVSQTGHGKVTHGQTGTGSAIKLMPSNPADNVNYGAQLGPG